MIAVVGSGITGLTAAWAIGKYRDVTLFEKFPEIGMAAFGAKQTIDGKNIEFDIPFRTIKRDYYPTLFQVYDKAGIKTRPVDYSFSVESNGDSVFGFRSHQILGIPFGIPTLDSFRTGKGRQIFSDLLKFYANAKEDWKKENPTISILDFLVKHGYSTEFIYEFLLPTFALVNTCKTETVGAYPAETIIGYHSRGYSYTPQETASSGTRDIVNRLTTNLKNLTLNAGIQKIYKKNDKTIIQFTAEEKEFDHVILSTQANQAKDLLGVGFDLEKEVLNEFRYESSDVVLHTDESYFLNPKVSLIFKIRDGFDKPEVTLDLGRIIPELKGKKIFQTWNPHKLPKDADTLKVAKFERPVMDERTAKAIQRISAIHSQAKCNLWLCGSYSLYGIPLLEAGAKSALQVASRLLNQNIDELIQK
ncbi:NAD(P)-binding protein [Leptospira sp. 2 VSF19]|uniref:NAD(P)-binding protein n=1 Tax=Leptospira soteropolitanensis TaxID=2950025 RepID=A0AAW5VG42_9LEPT|nr:NAD(P)-binding protein [Leptospira soteropolitanensis]MCW7494176.1 NAD(P)-binding protein [Leptospira soteropolitanensis]MCW7501849.1 NAD(P)-binding protein [Leptospira soteropolitanensis]MCW7524022.1 NAD(P)-binding protein [Leptospira soteropolitanensis]MCW7527887.1 NAD(P)-binding protein [Leptospira soteropolitanensis]MCW7531819.1 NAD(P)-binding protein [Leptospira soteropolitanensis]